MNNNRVVRKLQFSNKSNTRGYNMEYTIMGRIYPIILNNVVINQLKKYYTGNEIMAIIKNTKKEYLNILSRTPKMGGNRNLYIGNMYLGAYLTGLFKNITEKITLEQYNEMIQTGLKKSVLLKLKMKSINYLSKKYRRNLYKRSAWAKANEAKYPWNWQIRIPEDKKDSGIYFEFTQCGLCKLCINENVPDLIHLMCDTDYVSLHFGGYRLIRTKTLAHGNDCCDFWIIKK